MQSSAGTHIIKTHELLLRKLVQKDLLRTYSYYLKFKYRYTSSRLNGGNRAHLSRQVGISDKTSRIQINKLLKLGWARYEGNDIVFVRLKDIYKQQNLPLHRFANTCTFTTTRQATVSDLTALLASKLLEHNLDTQKFMRGVKATEIYSTTSEKEQKYVKRLSFDPKKFNGSQDSSVMSCNGFGRLIGRGTTSGANIKKKMLKMGLIKAECNLALLRSNVGRHIFDAMQERRFCSHRYYSSCDRSIYQRNSDYISMTIA